MTQEGDNERALGRVADGITRTFERYTGRSSQTTRIQASDELVSVLVDDGLTPAERGLADVDGGDGVRLLRWEEQEAMREELIAIVETELGRDVIAFMSANHVDPDLAVETFVLAQPETG